MVLVSDEVNGKRGSPGVSREQRICEEGLQRLERQLSGGRNIAPVVLRQWIRRYGDEARQLLRTYGRYTDELEE